MKKLYLIAGGTDGYCSIRYTFDYDLALKVMDDNQEAYSGFDDPDSINVPDDATYESLGISYSLEDDLDEDFEDEESDE